MDEVIKMLEEKLKLLRMMLDQADLNILIQEENLNRAKKERNKIEGKIELLTEIINELKKKATESQSER